MVLLSGGLDSTVLLYHLHTTGQSVSAVLFNYGQINKHQELNYARLHCDLFNQRHAETFGGWSEMILPTLWGSALTDGQGTKIVPNRNMVLLSAAASFAASNRIQRIAIGCNATDAKDFPDCRLEFINAMNTALTASRTNVTVIAPFLNMTKREIAKIGHDLDVPVEATWSCYTGNQTPCGACDACRARAEALS